MLKCHVYRECLNVTFIENQSFTGMPICDPQSFLIEQQSSQLLSYHLFFLF